MWEGGGVWRGSFLSFVDSAKSMLGVNYHSYLEFSDRQAYSKCPKLSNINVSDKMTYANSADPD